MRFHDTSHEDVMVPMLVMIFIPVSAVDVASDGDGGKSFAKDVLRDMELKIGDVPVTARALDGGGLAAFN